MSWYEVDGALAELPFMLDFTEGLQYRVMAALKEVSTLDTFAMGTQLFEEGDEGSDCGYVVLKGAVTVERSTGFSANVQAPVLLGEMKQFHFNLSDARAATVRAAESLEVLRFDWGRLYTVIDDRTTDEERKVIREALESYAWMHFLELEDEL
jgi:CRP-like cAMP-binding protein